MKIQLLELFTSIYPFKLSSGKHGCDGSFTTKDGHEVNLVATDTAWPNAMSVEFSRADVHDINNKGDAFKIFSTIIAMLKQIVKEKHPTYICFFSSPNEPSRTALYKTLCKRAEKDGFELVNLSNALKNPQDKLLYDIAYENAVHDKKLGPYVPDWFFLLKKI